jgi:hypothetical protein
LLRGSADLGAGNAISPSLKRWTGQQDIRSNSGYRLLQDGESFLTTLLEEVVAADESGFDSIAWSDTRQEPTWPDRPLTQLGRVSSPFLPAYPTEKLVDEVEDPERLLGHGATRLLFAASSVIGSTG